MEQAVKKSRSVLNKIRYVKTVRRCDKLGSENEAFRHFKISQDAKIKLLQDSAETHF